MNIRKKRTILLLGIALVPAVLISALFIGTMSETGSLLTDHTRDILTRDAERHLLTIVDDFGRITNGDRTVVELALSRQAQEVERILAGQPPGNQKILFSRDYDAQRNLPADMTVTDKYSKMVNGREIPIPVTFSQQVFFPVRSVDQSEITDDMALLNTMTPVYRELYQLNPRSFLWLYMALETGFHSCYPGHGGYPEEYDPRVRLWYTRARDADAITWITFPVVSTRKVSLTASIPVKRPDGTFAGVTAIDVQLISMLNTISLPKEWQDAATILHVSPSTLEGKLAERFLILAQESYVAQGEEWEKQIEWQYLDSTDTDKLAMMKADVVRGKPGVVRMNYQGTDSLCAYGSWRRGFPLAVVIVPYERIVSEAASTEQFMQNKLVGGLKAAGIALVCVLVIVAGVAIVSSRSITKPVSKLAHAAGELSSGNFGVRVDIRTRDELEDLSHVFNEIGPKLLEREKMKHSLELAREIQQRLLPQEAPQLPGFDIAGRSVYCDETGGDYYDFIDLSSLHPGVTGIALGDVTGHGIPAALLMATARSLLRSQARSHVNELAALFTEVNSQLVSDTGDDRFMTLFYGVLDAENKTFRWASAGHDPAIWLRSDGAEARELGATGMPLGVMDDVPFEDDGPVSLAKGDMVLVGTDGIWEAANTAGEQFGKDRLRRIMCEHASESAEGIISSIVNAVADFQGEATQEDDITMVVIKSL